MSESTGTEETNEIDAPQPTPLWLCASAKDVASINFEAPLNGITTADCQELSDCYRLSIKPGDDSAAPADASAIRVFTMLQALTGMHFKPKDRNEPFGPMMVYDGRRSPIPSDFRSHVDIIANMAERARNPVLRARLSDVCWLLERKQVELATAAIASYVDIVEKTALGELKYRFAEESGALQHEARDYLHRALQIGRAVGRDMPETIAARKLVKKLRKLALTEGGVIPILWFSGLDLDFGVSDPADVGASLDQFLAYAASQFPSRNIVDLWRLAARAYHLAKRDDDKNRCLGEAADMLVAEAESNQGSAMMAAHLLSSAIAQLHGIPGKKDRRTALCHRLVDIQAHVSEEMTIFSQELDLHGIVERAQEAVSRGSLLDKLFIFAALENSPEPKKLASDAEIAIRESPLASLFGASHLDHEGKVICRTQGSTLGNKADDSAVHYKIGQAESIRRKIVSSGLIEPARQAILEQHFISEDFLAALFQYSPFVPPDLVWTFARGYARFFQGDFVSATYIITPLLENSLRYILKSYGHDVTIFFDATQTQEDRTISSLFGQLRTELDSILTPDITADIERVFLAKPGPYLRHAVAHGLLHDGDPYGADAIYGCWLIFRLCLLPLFSHRQRLRSLLGGPDDF